MGDWLPALLTGGLATATAVGLAFWGSRQQRANTQLSADERHRVDGALARLEADLAGRSATDSARREYEYSALKRLYAEVNPLIFQLRELCRGSSNRGRRIVSSEIDLHRSKHLLTSTQRIFAPMVVVQEIQRHLTALDLRLDDTLSAQYQVAREILWNFHAGVALSTTDPVIPYRTGDHYEGGRQHLTHAQLLRLVDFLTVEESGGLRRPMKQTELDDAFEAGHPDCLRALAPVERLFANSGPSTSPILWRILLAHSILLHVFADLVDQNTSTIGAVLPPDIETFAWTTSDPPDFARQVAAAESFVRQRLRTAGVLHH